MELEKIAQNLYKKHLGRYLVYDMEGLVLSFKYRGQSKRCKIVDAKRDVFGRKLYLTDSKGTQYKFREPTYITRDDNGDFIFNYSQESEKQYMDEKEAVMEHTTTTFKVVKRQKTETEKTEE